MPFLASTADILLVNVDERPLTHGTLNTFSISYTDYEEPANVTELPFCRTQCASDANDNEPDVTPDPINEKSSFHNQETIELEEFDVSLSSLPVFAPMISPNLNLETFDRGKDHYFCFIIWLSFLELEIISRFEPIQTATSEPCTPLAACPEKTKDNEIIQEFALIETVDSLGKFRLLLFFA